MAAAKKSSDKTTLANNEEKRAASRAASLALQGGMGSAEDVVTNELSQDPRPPARTPASSVKLTPDSSEPSPVKRTRPNLQQSVKDAEKALKEWHQSGESGTLPLSEFTAKSKELNLAVFKAKDALSEFESERKETNTARRKKAAAEIGLVNPPVRAPGTEETPPAPTPTETKGYDWASLSSRTGLRTGGRTSTRSGPSIARATRIARVAQTAEERAAQANPVKAAITEQKTMSGEDLDWIQDVNPETASGRDLELATQAWTREKERKKPSMYVTANPPQKRRVLIRSRKSGDTAYVTKQSGDETVRSDEGNVVGFMVNPASRLLLGPAFRRPGRDQPGGSRRYSTARVKRPRGNVNRGMTPEAAALRFSIQEGTRGITRSLMQEKPLGVVTRATPRLPQLDSGAAAPATLVQVGKRIVKNKSGELIEKPEKVLAARVKKGTETLTYKEGSPADLEANKRSAALQEQHEANKAQYQAGLEAHTQRIIDAIAEEQAARKRQGAEDAKLRQVKLSPEEQALWNRTHGLDPDSLKKRIEQVTKGLNEDREGSVSVMTAPREFGFRGAAGFTGVSIPNQPAGSVRGNVAPMVHAKGSTGQPLFTAGADRTMVPVMRPAHHVDEEGKLKPEFGGVAPARAGRSSSLQQGTQSGRS